MNTTMKKFLLISVLAATFASCSDDDTPVNPPVTPVADGIITSLTDVDYSATDLKGNIGANISLPVGEYILSGALVVKAPFTLTIAPGTTFKATPGGTSVYVAVEQGAKINAAGTAALPILFTSNSGNKRSGDWGGLLIMGKAPLSGGGTSTTEVVDFTYGGTDTNDNSGVLTYVIVEYTGARINGDKEFNGMTFYGVGKGTTVNNIVSNFGDDDAIEFFGGSVNVTNVLVVNAKDDMFDWTQGYTGTIDNAYGIRELGFNDVTSDPRGIEADGNLDGLSPTQAGQSDVIVTNLTIVSNSIVPLNDVIKIRRGSKATITNCLVKLGATAPAPGDLVDCSDSLGSAAAGTTVTLVGIGVNLNLADNNLGTNNATVNATAGSTGGANTSVFAWTGYTFN